MSRFFNHAALASIILLSAIAHPAQARRSFAYIGNYSSEDVSVIDTTSNTVVSAISSPSGPLAAVGLPAGNRVYIANFNSSTVSVVDTADNTVITTIAVGANPEYIAVNAAGTKVYVTNRYSDNASVIDTATNAVVATIALNSQPVGIVLNPAGTFAYVAHNSAGRLVSVVNTATNTVVANIPMGGGSFYPFGLDINPAGTRLYVTNDASIRVIDTATNAIIATVPVGIAPRGVAVSPDGTRVYVTSGTGNTVAVINALTNTVVTNVPVGASPWGIATDPASGNVYVANSNGNTMSVIDAGSNTVTATINVGSFPIAFGKFVVSVPESNLAIRTRGPTSVVVKNVARVNIVVDNYGPESASNAVVAITTNGPASAFKLTAAAGWTCALDAANPAAAKFLCAAGSDLAVGGRPEFVLAFTAPASMASSTLSIGVGISSDGFDGKVDNNSATQNIDVTALRSVQPPQAPALSKY